MSKANELGKNGEQLARDYLVREGFQILESNWTSEVGEIDIIALKQDLLCFIEVKTRSSTAYGHPEEAVTIEKQRKIGMLAEQYLEQSNRDYSARFDIISVIWNNSVAELRHYKDAYAPTDF